MLDTTEHEIFPAHKCKKPTIVGILTFMSPKNGILCFFEHKKAKFLDIFVSPAKQKQDICIAFPAALSAS